MVIRYQWNKVSFGGGGGGGGGVGLDEWESGRQDSRRSATKNIFNSAVAGHFQNWWNQLIST
jgi:hypothetical protein